MKLWTVTFTNAEGERVSVDDYGEASARNFGEQIALDPDNLDIELTETTTQKRVLRRWRVQIG